MLLAVKPAVLGLLIDVHRSTEYEHGAEPVERWPRFLGGDPLDQLEAPLSRRVREDAAAGVSFVNDRQDAHLAKFHKARLVQGGGCR